MNIFVVARFIRFESRMSFKSHATQATECAIGLSFEFIMKQHVENVAMNQRKAATASARATATTKKRISENKQTVNNIMFDEHMNRHMQLQ